MDAIKALRDSKRLFRHTEKFCPQYAHMLMMPADSRDRSAVWTGQCLHKNLSRHNMAIIMRYMCVPSFAYSVWPILVPKGTRAWSIYL